MRKFSSEGVILKRVNYGEADRFLTVYSKDFGKISLLAKGVRKPISRKRGHVEVFSLIKFSGVKGKTLYLLEEAWLIQSFPRIRDSLKKTLVAYFLLETVDKLTHEHEPNHNLYNLLLATLSKLQVATRLKSLRKNFVVEALIILGFWPMGKPLSDPDRVLRTIAEKEISTIRVGKRILEGGGLLKLSR